MIGSRIMELTEITKTEFIALTSKKSTIDFGEKLYDVLQTGNKESLNELCRYTSNLYNLLKDAVVNNEPTFYINKLGTTYYKPKDKQLELFK